jgi:protein SCO1/2
MRAPALALLLAALSGLAPAAARDERPPAGLGGPIDLVDQGGRAFHLAQLGTRRALVFFGFAHCGTTCPTALLAARQVLGQPTAGGGAPVVLFVTLDPLGDTPERLRDYLGAFDPRVIGLTGTPGQVWRVAERYRVGIGRDGGTLAHSAKWYVVDAAGRVDGVYDVDTPPGQLAAALRGPQPTAKDTPR